MITIKLAKQYQIWCWMHKKDSVGTIRMTRSLKSPSNIWLQNTTEWRKVANSQYLSDQTNGIFWTNVQYSFPVTLPCSWKLDTGFYSLFLMPLDAFLLSTDEMVSDQPWLDLCCSKIFDRWQCFALRITDRQVEWWRNQDNPIQYGQVMHIWDKLALVSFNFSISRTAEIIRLTIHFNNLQSFDIIKNQSSCSGPFKGTSTPVCNNLARCMRSNSLE